MSWDTVDLEWSGDVATVTVDRPDALNALNVETLEALEEAIDEARKNDAHVLMLRGAGDDAFISGADIEYMKDLSTAEAQAWGELGHRVTQGIEHFPAPSVAVVDGYAFGGGCEMAMACDLRIGSESALIGKTEIDLGIISIWGGTQRLPRLVGEETAKRMIYLGERIDAETAEEEGLFGEVVPDDEIDDRAAELATELESKPAFALQAAKNSIAQRYSDTGGLAYEIRASASLFGTPDQREGMEAFVEKRDADFE